jgi:hypothetical protein
MGIDRDFDNLMANNTCPGCDKETPTGHNYCSWDCQVRDAKESGGEVHCPNGLPIGCIRHDDNMYEHEHGDHTDYKFPVDVKFIGIRPELPEWDDSYTSECHALIYTDGHIALTLYECNYSMWSLSDGSYLGGRYNDKNWRLDEVSLTKIKDYGR